MQLTDIYLNKQSKFIFDGDVGVLPGQHKSRLIAYFSNFNQKHLIL